MIQAPQAVSRVARVKPDLVGWLESIRQKTGGWGRWPYHARMERPWALQASGIAIRLLKLLGELEGVAPARRAEAIANLQACQDPADGLFKDPMEDEACHEGPHTWEQVWGQRNGAATEALNLLGAEPLYPPAAAQFADLRAVDPAEWTLRGLDWSNPWAQGESWSRAICVYLRQATAGEDPADDPRLVAAFEAVEREIIDPRTGMPSRRMPSEDPSRAMAGLFKVSKAYLSVGRPLPHPEAALDATLALQHDDGEFGYRDNMCINWDALNVLRLLNQQLDGGYRFEDIRDAGDRCAEMLLRKYRQDDGAFAFHGHRCQRNHHSIRLSAESYPIGDMLGTIMCVRCLQYADEWDGIST